MCAWAALRGGWSGVMHSILACAVIGCPCQERREARTDDSPRARFIPADDVPAMGRQLA